MDTWQYFVHRYMHQNKYLYRHIHSQHHRLVVTYAIGALYNHPLEGLLLDTVGGAISFLVSGMTARTAVIFFCFATVKTVDDHCGLWLPGNVFHMIFRNNTAYHDVHHQLQGTKYNYSQPFFPIWDVLLGTHMPYRLVKRPEGGFEARLMKDWSFSSAGWACHAFCSSYASIWGGYTTICIRAMYNSSFHGWQTWLVYSVVSPCTCRLYL